MSENRRRAGIKQSCVPQAVSDLLLGNPVSSLQLKLGKMPTLNSAVLSHVEDRCWTATLRANDRAALPQTTGHTCDCRKAAPGPGLHGLQVRVVSAPYTTSLLGL